MNLGLDDDESAGLRQAATRAGLSMHEVARLAISEWVARTDGMTMSKLMARPPLGGGTLRPGTAARLLREARLEAGRA